MSTTRTIEELEAEVERLQREVVNRNQRALDGDLAVKVRDAELLINDQLRAQLAAAQGQLVIPSDVREMAEKIQKNVYRTPLSWAAKVIDFVADYAAPIPQQPAEPVHVLDTPLSEDAEKAFADFGEAYVRMEMAMKDGINVHGAVSNLSGCQDNLRIALAAPQPKEKQ